MDIILYNLDLDDDRIRLTTQTLFEYDTEIMSKRLNINVYNCPYKLDYNQPFLF